MPYGKVNPHDWRIGDRVSSIAVRESVGVTGLANIQKIMLDKAIVFWDDGTYSEEYLDHLILAGFDESKVFSAEYTGNITTSLDPYKESVSLSKLMASGLPLSLIWGVSP